MQRLGAYANHAHTCCSCNHPYSSRFLHTSSCVDSQSRLANCVLFSTGAKSHPYSKRMKKAAHGLAMGCKDIQRCLFSDRVRPSASLHSAWEQHAIAAQAGT